MRGFFEAFLGVIVIVIILVIIIISMIFLIVLLTPYLTKLGAVLSVATVLVATAAGLVNVGNE